MTAAMLFTTAHKLATANRPPVSKCRYRVVIMSEHGDSSLVRRVICPKRIGI